MAKTITDKKERKKLKVVWVSEVTPFGDKGKKVKFNAEDGLTYETFSQSLFEYIVTGKELDADTELRITTADDSNQYPHWIVTQIYQDGQPIGSKGKWGYSREKSPEERASIENQVRAKIISELWIADKFKDDDIEVKRLRQWLNPESPTISQKPSGKSQESTEHESPPPEGLDFDPQQLKDDLNEVKWKDGTVKSWCKSMYKIDKEGQPLDTEGSVVDVVARLSKEHREAFFKEIEDRKQIR